MSKIRIQSSVTAVKPWRWLIDAALLWVAGFGVFPLADPGHSGFAPLVLLDVTLHIGSLVALHCRWAVVRRQLITAEIDDSQPAFVPGPA